MPTVIPITSLADDPRLLPYANQRDAHLRAAHLRDGEGREGGEEGPESAHAGPTSAEPGLLIAEGELVVRMLLSSAYEVRSLLLRTGNEKKFERDLDELEARTGVSTPVFTTSQEVLDGIVGFHVHRGVLGCGERKRRSNSEQRGATGGRDLGRDVMWDEGEMIGSARTLLLLEDLSNHDNVGGIFRNIGCLCPVERTAALLSPRCCDPLYRKSIRVSMGHALRVPFVQSEDWNATLEKVEGGGFTLTAMMTGAGAVPIAEVAWPERVALVLGAEGPGLRKETIDRCSLRVRIPMAPGTDSLNVAMAAGIAMSWMRLV